MLFDLFRWKPANALPFRRSVAFLVGVGHYTNLRPELPFVESDLTELRNFLLTDGGFDVVFEVRDGTVRRSLIEDYMVNKFTKASYDLNADDRLLFYYSGHGADQNGHIGYLQFSNASTDNFAGEDILPLHDFQDWARLSVAKHLLIILDACASGLAIKAQGGTTPEAVLQSLSGEGSGFLLTAGTGDQKAYQIQLYGQKGFSVFTHALLDALRSGVADGDNTGFLTINEVFAHAEKEIGQFEAENGRKMTPQLWPLSRRNGIAKGTFVFLNTNAQNPKIQPRYANVLTTAKGPGEDISLTAARFEEVRAALLAAQAESNQVPDLSHLTLGALIAIESLKRNRSWQADLILRRGLAFLPRPVGLYNLARPTTELALSRDESYLARATPADDVGVWNTETGKLVFSAPRSSDASAVVFAAGRPCMGIATRAGAIAVWDIAQHSELLTETKDAPISALSLNPDCTQIAVGTINGGVQLQSLLSQLHKEAPSKIGDRRIDSLAYSSDGLLVAGGDSMGRITVWQVKDGSVLSELDQRRPIVALSFNDKSSRLAAASEDGRIVIWSTGDEAAPQMDVSLPLPVLALGFSNSSGAIFVVHGRAMSIFNVQNGQELMTASADGPILLATFSPNGSRLATLTGDNSLAIWELHAENEPTPIETGHHVNAMAFGEKESSPQVFAASGDGVSVCSLTGSCQMILPQADCNDIQLSDDDRYLYCQRGNRTNLYDLKRGIEIEPHAGERYLALLSDSRIASASSHELMVRAIGNETLIARWPLPRIDSNPVVSTRATYVAVAGSDNSINVAKLSTGKMALKIADVSNASDVFFLSDAIAAVTENDKIEVCDVARQSIVTYKVDERDKQSPDRASFSSDGKYFKTQHDTTLHVWRRSAHGFDELFNVFDVDTSEFSPDGHIAVVTKTGLLRLWDLAASREVVRLTAGNVDFVGFSRDGKYLGMVADSAIRVLPWHSEDLITEACHRVSRNFSLPEWGQFFGVETYVQTCPNLPIGELTVGSSRPR